MEIKVTNELKGDISPYVEKKRPALEKKFSHLVQNISLHLKKENNTLVGKACAFMQGHKDIIIEAQTEEKKLEENAYEILDDLFHRLEQSVMKEKSKIQDHHKHT